MNVNLHNLSKIVSGSNGYLSVNRRSGDLQTKGGSFLGRLIIWIRFKTSSSYRNAMTDAKRKVMLSMLSDEIYGDDFRLKIERLDKKNGFFFDNKPLSARKVRRFMNNVMQSVGQSQPMSDEERRVGLVNWVCGKGGTIASGETFNDNLGAMLAAKISEVRGIAAADVDLRGISDEISRAALNDREGMAAVFDDKQATAHVDKIMSEVLDSRIADAHSQRQMKLHQRLSVSGLAVADIRRLHEEIASSEITTMDELDSRVNQLVIKQLDNDFTELLERVRAKHNFRAELAQLPEVSKQLGAALRQQNEHRMLSVDHARNEAERMLDRWIGSKQEALLASQESRYPDVRKLLSKLCSEEPRVKAADVQSFAQTIEQTLDEVYAADRTVYEALGIDKEELFAMLSSLDRRSLLFRHLQSTVKETRGMSSLFDGDTGRVPDMKATIQKYIESLTKTMIKSYAEVSALRTKVPDPIYRTMIEKVSKGYAWDARFISAANGLHIDSLVQNDNQDLYELLDSPQVARKNIGSKEDFSSFSLEDLLRAILGPKNIDNHKKRQQALDRVLPETLKVELLNELNEQLQMVRSRVMDAKDANALFQRGTVRFLRSLKINFAAMSSEK